MKNFRFLLLAVSVLFSTAALAEVKIGFINSQRVINEAPQAAQAKKRIEREFEKRDQDLQRMAQQLKALQESLEKNAAGLSETARKNKEREFADLNRDFQRKQREFQEDLNLRRNEEMASIFEHVNKVINTIAEQEKYDLIVQEAVYFSAGVDITDKVLRVLNNESKQ